MTDFDISRRTALSLAGGATMLGGLALPASANNVGVSTASEEINSIRANIGRVFHVTRDQASARAVLEDVVELAPKVRRPFSVGQRAPFAVVFRHDGGDQLKDGTLDFSSGGLGGAPLLVSCYTGDDGVGRFEAVFN